MDLAASNCLFSLKSLRAIELNSVSSKPPFPLLITSKRVGYLWPWPYFIDHQRHESLAYSPFASAHTRHLGAGVAMYKNLAKAIHKVKSKS